MTTLRPGTLDDLDAIFPRFQGDFPESEQLTRVKLEHLLASGHYHLVLAQQHEVTVGYAFVYEPAAAPIIWLDYLAVTRHLRGGGYGAWLFEQVAYHRPGALGTLLEVERADSLDPTVRREQTRRIAFYTGRGARALDVDYKLPTPDGGVSMTLFFRPMPGAAMLMRAHLEATVTSVFEVLHDDVPDRQALLKPVLRSFHDIAKF